MADWLVIERRTDRFTDWLADCFPYRLIVECCRGLPIKTRRKIKCLPFSPSGSRGLWCDRINSFFCGGGTCNLSCFEVFKNSSNQIYSPSSTENSIFEVEHCRCFEIVIGAKYLGTFVYGRKNVFFFWLFFSSSSSCNCCYYVDVFFLLLWLSQYTLLNALDYK